MQVIFILLFTILINSVTFASECRAVQWPFSKNVKNIQPASLQAIPRDHLYKYLYHELSVVESKRIPNLASKLFHYIKNTEQNDDKYQMIMAVEWASELNTTKPRVIPVSEICKMEVKINKDLSLVNKQSIKRKK